MILNIEINTANSAFDDPNELRRVLESIASRVDTRGGLQRGPLSDINGNKVGVFEHVARS